MSVITQPQFEPMNQGCTVNVFCEAGPQMFTDEIAAAGGVYVNLMIGWDGEQSLSPSYISVSKSEGVDWDKWTSVGVFSSPDGGGALSEWVNEETVGISDFPYDIAGLGYDGQRYYKIVLDDGSGSFLGPQSNTILVTRSLPY